MNSASEERQLGEYRLTELLAENAFTRTWLAEQISVSRKVLLDELREGQSDHRDTFLANVRAKASVDHPLIGSVYEAVAEPGCCFYAHELLPGVTLAERENARQPFQPGQLAHVLRRVAEAHLQHEALGHSTSPMGLDAVHLDEHGVIRLKNLAIAGPRYEDESVRDVVHLGNALVPLVAEGQPGATRMLTLFSWMRGEGLEAPINWGQVRDFCMQIEHQLADPLSIVNPHQDGSHGAKKHTAALIAVGTGVVLLGIAAIAFTMRPPLPSPPPRASLPGPLTVAAGKHPTPDGAEGTLPAFRISANEVTIGQYAEFLETLGMLAKEKRERTFDLTGQPAEKSSHEPTDWPALLAAAKANGTWQNQPVTLDSPVVGIDWWDASAYAEWKKARLPSQEEWFAALNMDEKAPAAIPPGPWAPVTAQTSDRTRAGLIGMAGSVCEWTSGMGTNPANPLGDRRWVIIGGSYLKPGTNALTREWTLDRSLRRPDLGFRVVLIQNSPHHRTMNLPANLVTIHPYFKAHPGKSAEVDTIMEKFVAKTRGEAACCFYEFTVLGDEVFCREGYVGAAGVLHHLDNIGGILAEMLTVADLTRLEFHGPAEEIDQLRGPLGHLNPAWFVLRRGIER